MTLVDTETGEIVQRMALAVPRPSDVGNVYDLCERTELVLPLVEDVGEACEAKAKFAAIDKYLQQTSTDGRSRLAATMRRLEARIGELIGAPLPNGGVSRNGLSATNPFEMLRPEERSEFRLMAAHPDVVEAVISDADDKTPPSRRKVVAAIRTYVKTKKMEGDGVLTKLEQVRTCASLGFTPEQIAEELNTTKTYVNLLAQKAGIALTKNSRLAIDARVDVAKRMASEGHTSRQIAKAIGIDHKNMSEFRKRHGFTVPADAVVGVTAHIDRVRVIQETVFALEGLAMGLGMIDLAGFDHPDLPMWRTSMRKSMKTITDCIKETR